MNTIQPSAVDCRREDSVRGFKMTDANLTVKLPAWFDETLQYGFCNMSGMDAFTTALEHDAFKKADGRFDTVNLKGFILMLYNVHSASGNAKAELIYSALYELETATGDPFTNDTAMEVVAKFDYAFACCIEKILS